MTSTCPMHRRQRGQSIVEFLVALAVLVPLFLAITYAGRYGDLQQQATQASRYAAFQRAMQPSGSRLSDATLQDQMRTRFFVAGDYLNKGRIQSDDSLTKITKSDAQPALWDGLDGQPLLTDLPNKVTLQWGTAAIGSGGVSAAMRKMTETADKTYTDGHVARVEVSLLNRMNQDEATPAPLVIAAGTATAGNGLGSAGSQDTRDSVATAVPIDRVPDVVTGLLDMAISLFEPEGPELGCIKPDVVPGHRLDGGADNRRCR